MIKRMLMILIVLTVLIPLCYAEQASNYETGMELKLKIKVNIWGQVKAPGEYLVDDGTDLIGLISAAGGPTDYADLRKIKIIRKTGDRKKIIVNLKNYIDNPETEAIPVLQPGDIIIVPKSIRADWNMVIQVISQIAIIVNVIYLLNKK